MVAFVALLQFAVDKRICGSDREQFRFLLPHVWGDRVHRNFWTLSHHAVFSTSTSAISRLASKRRLMTFSVASSTSMASRAAWTRSLNSSTCASERSAMSVSVCHLRHIIKTQVGSRPRNEGQGSKGRLPHLSLDMRGPPRPAEAEGAISQKVDLTPPERWCSISNGILTWNRHTVKIALWCSIRIPSNDLRPKA